MHKLKCCLIGYGYWGKIVHKYLLNNPRIEFKGVYSRHLPNSVNLNMMLETSSIDVAFVCTPICTHYDIVERLLNNGVHVFCEKTLTDCYERSRELIELAKIKKRILYTDYIYSNSASIKYITDYIKTSAMNPIYVEMEISQLGKIYRDADVLGVIGVHMISSLFVIFGVGYEFSVLNMYVLNRDEQNNVQGIEFDFEYGFIKGRIKCSLVDTTKRRIINIYSDNTVVSFDMMRNPPVQIIDNISTDFEIMLKNMGEKYYDESNNLEHAINEFADCINEKVDISVNQVLTLKVEKTIEKIRNSLDEEMRL